MPCTAGTFYSHYIGKIISSNKPIIIPETNPCNILKRKRNSFIPYSLNTSSFLIGLRNFDEYLEEYKNELISFMKKWERSQSDTLVIRDHVWGEFTSPKSRNSSKPILSEILTKSGIDYYPIFTKRDPIDSWLSLNSNFPDIEINLIEYKNIYHKAINGWRNFYGNKLIEIKIEDFVLNKEKIKSQFKENLNISLDDVSLKQTIGKDELLSGASGRGNSYPKILKRKPFSFLFWAEITRNKDFLEFRKEIGYSKEFKLNNIFCLTKSLFHSIYQPLINLKIRNKKIKCYLKMAKYLAYR